MNRFRNVIILAAVLLTSISYAQQDQTNSITMEQFKEKLKTDKELIVLDVRTPEEVAAGKIENSINIPVQVLEERINELEKYKDKEIFVLCRTQNRSSAAQSILKKNGYNAKYVIGGMSVYNQK
ncbi:MAG TPA: rhodanese-like domain-containing protein [Ignavibacteriaceae bacterium]